MAPTTVIVIVGFWVAVIASIASYRREPNRRARRLLASAAAKPLEAVVDGDRARVHGVARRGPEGTVEAPFTRRACFAFRVIIEEQVENDWQEITRQELGVPFQLVADGLEARIDGPFLLALEVDARGDNHREGELPDAFLDAFAALGVSPYTAWGHARHLRYLEAALEPGDPIWVLGAATKSVDPTGWRDTPRGQPQKRVISGTKRAPTIVADEDQPGVLDPFG
jgi:hypothetical protein